MGRKFLFVTFILSFLFFFQALPVFAQGAMCDYCGISITYSNLGKKTPKGYLCKDCYKKSYNKKQNASKFQQQAHQKSKIYKCSTCGQIFRGKGGTDGINYYCSSCLDKLQSKDVIKSELTCNNCHKKIGIAEQYAKGRDAYKRTLIYCVDCAKQNGLFKNFKCVKCNQVIGGTGYKTERDQYGNFIYTCEKCATGNNKFKSDTKCTVCGKGLGDYASKKANGKSYRYEYYKTINNKPYCLECKEKYKDICKICTLPIPPGDGTRNGSYLTCKYCSKDIVVTDEELQQLFAKACAFMREYFGLTVPVTPDNVFFSDISEMRDIMSILRTDDIPRSYGQNPVGLFSRRGDYKCIRVQKGMPKLNVLETLVHEGAHACMSEFGYNQKTNLIYSEGFAEWCAYKYLVSIGETRYYYRKIKRKDKIYGDGLRKMLELEQKLSANGLLKYVFTHSDFPQEN